MEDYKFLWYIIAAVIYFLTRGKKKKQEQTRPGTEKTPSPQDRPKSFEDLLREITEGTKEEQSSPAEQTVVEVEKPYEREEKRRQEQRQSEGVKRAFADDESRRVYEQSIKMAEGADLEFKPDEHFAEPRLFKGSVETLEDEWTIADEIRDGLNTTEAKKAIIYSEILTRKY